MYNLTVDLVATYLVGEQGWVVHNTSYYEKNCILHPNVMNAIQLGIRDYNTRYDTDLMVGSRWRDPLTSYYDHFAIPKPIGSRNIDVMPNGLRVIYFTSQKSIKVISDAYSDLDLAWSVNMRTGIPLSNNRFINPENLFDPNYLGGAINRRYINAIGRKGIPIVQHGPHIHGLINNLPGATVDRAGEIIRMINANGNVGSGYMIPTFENLLNDAKLNLFHKQLDVAVNQVWDSNWRGGITIR